jgi:hypothetical protein
MLVDLRPHARLRGKTPVDLTTSVTPVLEALGEDDADLDRVRVVCDWVQYKQSFRDVVDVRPILSCDGTGAARPRRRSACATTTSRWPSTCGAAAASRSRS